MYFDIQRFLIAVCNSGDKNKKASYYYPIIAEAKQLIKNSVPENKPVNSQILADSFHMSLPRFTKVFKLFTGMTPSQYLLQFKIHYAESLLDKGLTVKETASLLGYSDPFIFSKQFKKMTGISPKERKKITDNL